MNPSELADRLEELALDGITLTRSENIFLLASALRLAEAAADPNFPRLELGKLRAKYIEARGA